MFADLWKMPDAVTDSLRMYCGEEGYRPGDVCKTISSLRGSETFFMDELSDGQRERAVSFLNKKRKRSYGTLWLAEAGGRPVDAGRGRTFG